MKNAPYPVKKIEYTHKCLRRQTFWPNKLMTMGVTEIEPCLLLTYYMFVFVWSKYKKINRANKLSLFIRLIIFYLHTKERLILFFVEEKVVF